MTPLCPERRALAERHIPLAVSVAKRFGRTYPRHRDDFFSASLWALCRAAATLDGPEDEFPGRAYWRAVGECLHVLRSRRRDADAIPPEWDAPSGEHPVGWELDSVDAVEGLCRGLPPQHRAVMVHRYTAAGSGNYADTGRAFGVGESRVNKIVNQSVEFLRSGGIR